MLAVGIVCFLLAPARLFGGAVRATSVGWRWSRSTTSWITPAAPRLRSASMVASEASICLPYSVPRDRTPGHVHYSTLPLQHEPLSPEACGT